MKKIVVLLVAFMVSVPAIASTQSGEAKVSAPATTANIRTGNWNVGGTFALTKRTGRGEDGASEVFASFSGKYFLIDRLALGLFFGLDAETGVPTVASLGPEATYFFWNDGALATFVGLGFRFGLTDATVNSILDTQLGAQYFVVPTVAVGPMLFFSRFNSKFSGQSYQRYGVAFGLNVYL